MKESTAVVLVDHGSTVVEANEAFERIVSKYAARYPGRIVEAAHMELAEPTIAQAVARAVSRGATRLVVHPYFLLPGKHWRGDIPRLTAAAVEPFPGLQWTVTQPLGESIELLDVVARRIDEAL